ncbi:MAG TPA: hypothetical protein VH186_06395 [Chloroflexia bacterium]|nr:hypothetical protein [Chloroflexia bacterium]
MSTNFSNFKKVIPGIILGLLFVFAFSFGLNSVTSAGSNTSTSNQPVPTVQSVPDNGNATQPANNTITDNQPAANSYTDINSYNPGSAGTGYTNVQNGESEHEGRSGEYKHSEHEGGEGAED